MRLGSVALVLMGAATLFSSGSAEAAFISDLSATPMLIGTVTAGTTYTVTESGISDLYTAFNGGMGLTFTADGKPTYDFPSPYSAFYPNGLDYDPSQNMNAYGVGGPGNLYGALLGTYSTSAPYDYFMIGTTFTATTTGALYGVVNDCSNCYGDNSATGGFDVTLTAQGSMSSVPLPASAPMFGAALVALGAAGYRARRKQASLDA